MYNPETRYRWLALVLCLTVTFLLFAVVPRAVLNDTMFDEHQYLTLAQGGAVLAPFSYRLLTPLLARLLPFGLDTNFQVISFVGIWLTGVVMYVLARAFRFVPPLALGGALAFYTLPTVGMLAGDPYLTEPLLFLFLVLALWSLKTRHDRLFALVLALGLLNKETMLAVVPLWFVFRPRDRRRGLLLMAPGLVLWAAVHLLIVPTIPYSVESMFTASLKVRLMRLRDTSLWTFLADLTLAPFGAWVVLALAAGRRSLYWQRFWPFLLMVYAQLFIAVDTGRLVVVAFPVVLLMALHTLQTAAGRVHLRLRTERVEA